MAMRTSVFLVAAVCVALAAAASDDFINTKVKRKIDATQHTVTIRTDYTVESASSSTKYVFSFPEADASHIAFLQAKSSGSILPVAKLATM